MNESKVSKSASDILCRKPSPLQTGLENSPEQEQQLESGP